MIPHAQNQLTAAEIDAMKARLAARKESAPIYDQIVRDMAILTTADNAHDELDITLPVDDITAAKRIFAAVILAVMVTAAIVAVILGMVLR